MSASTDLTTIIARVRELDAAATKGPWMAPHARVQAEQVGYVYRAEGMASQVARTMSTTRGMSDAALIAEYRTAAPALADEVERLAALFQQEAQQWRPLTESPASWPESGTRMAIVDAADMTRFRIATRVHAPEQMADFIVNGWTHWLPLPPPPKGTHDH